MYKNVENMNVKNNRNTKSPKQKRRKRKYFSIHVFLEKLITNCYFFFPQ